MEEKLKVIIGNAVLNSDPDDVIKLAKLVTYYNVQFNIIKRDADSELRNYIDSVQEKGKTFLE